MASTKVTISVADDHDVATVADGLRAAGVQVDQVLASAGVITGSVDPARIGALRAITGIADVEQERVVTIPRPDSKVQ